MTGQRLVLAMLVALSPLGAQITLDADPAGACSCASFTDQQAFEGADAVFAGEVIGYTPPPTAAVRSSVDPALWTFRVDRIYKGRVTATQEIVSEVESASCGLEVPIGEEILVFARRTTSISGLVPAADQYYAGLCGGTRPTSERPVPSSFGTGHRPSARRPDATAPGEDRRFGLDGTEICSRTLRSSPSECSEQGDTVTSVWIMLGPVLAVTLVAVVAVALVRRRRTRAS